MRPIDIIDYAAKHPQLKPLHRDSKLFLLRASEAPQNWTFVDAIPHGYRIGSKMKDLPDHSPGRNDRAKTVKQVGNRTVCTNHEGTLAGIGDGELFANCPSCDRLISVPKRLAVVDRASGYGPVYI